MLHGMAQTSPTNSISGEGSIPEDDKSNNLRHGLLEDSSDGIGESEGGTISISQILSLKERFDRADTDGGGSLDLQEFMDAFGSIINKDGSMTDEQTKRLFMQIDANSDGGIDWNEFSTYMLIESMTGSQNHNQKAGSFYLPDSAGQRQPAENFHRDFVDCAQVDPSGMYYITSAKDGSIRLWAQGSLQLVKTIHLGQTWVLAMTTLPEIGRVAVSTDDRKIKFYDIHTWEVVMEVELQNPALCMCSWKHLDTEMFAYGNDVGEITIVDLGKGLKPANKIEEQQLAKKQTKRSKRWVESKTRIVHEGWVNQIRKIDDLGGVVSCGSDNTIKIFEVPFKATTDCKERVVPRRVLQHKAGHHKGVKSFEWVKTFKLIVTAGLERELIVWNPYTCKPVLTLNGHLSGMRMIMLNDDFEQLISLSLDKVIKVWDLRNNECIQTITKFRKPDTDAPTAFLVDKARHRMVSFGQRQQVFKINSAILYNTTEDTHRSPVVAVLYNRSFGNVITVAEDSECAVWRPATGEQIFTFFDTERNDETHCTCANFDEAGRRLLIGDHYGVVRVWNFNNGACIKTLVKPRDRHSRQEITDLCSYNFEDKRFFAATSWDRKVTVWADFSEDSGTVTPHMQMQGHDSDILSMAFFHPKSLAASCADGTISVFDIESGHKRMTLLTEKSRTGKTPRDSRAAISESQYIERVIFLEHKNGTMVSAGADGYLRFWEGQWMRSVPSHCAGSVNPSNLACLIPGNHYHGAAIVDVKADDENNYLVTADEAGFIKTWDISGYNWQKPSPDQVQPICFWQAHEVTINVLDIMVPANVEAHVEEELEPLVFSCAPDKRAMMWTIDGMHVGKFGQPLEKGSTRRTPWDLYTKSTWRSAESLNILGDQESALGSPISEDDFSGSGDDEDHFNAVLNDLDNRLRAKVPSKVVFDTFELEEAMPSETMNKGKKKGKDYVVDEITGERIYKTNAKKAVVGEEKRKSKFKAGATRLDTDLSKILKTSFAKNAQKEVTPRSEDPKEIERKITYATASTLMKVYEAKCERQGWGEPDAIQKDILCTKIRHSLQVLREPDSGVDKVANYLYKLGSNWEDMLSQVEDQPLEVIRI